VAAQRVADAVDHLGAEISRRPRQADRLHKRLGAGQAAFERRADSLQALLDRIANDHGSDSAVIDQQIIEKAGDLFDTRADDIFYFNKGRLYANYLLMRELGADFESVIREKGPDKRLDGTWETFRIAAELDPWIVWNGYPTGCSSQSSRRAGFLPAAGTHPAARDSNILLK